MHFLSVQDTFSEYQRFLFPLHSRKKLDSKKETFREMISRELANHEACITCNYTDALTALGLTWNGLTEEQQKITKQELKKQIKRYCEED